MWREPEWLQMGLDAMRDMFAVESELKQQMIDFLLEEGFWDREHLTPLASRTRFNACMNPAKSDFFKISELWALMARFGRHHLFLAMAADLGYEVRRKPTDERQQELMERLVVAQERMAVELANIHGELHRLDESEPAAAVTPHTATLRVHPAMREVGPKWSRDDDAAPGGF